VVVNEDFSISVLDNLSENLDDSSDIKPKYILINSNQKALTHRVLRQIHSFGEDYPDYQKIFVPCDMNDDIYCYTKIKNLVPDLDLYDWTQHPLQETIDLFHQATA